MQSDISLSLALCVRVLFSPLSITCIGSSSPAPPVNGSFVGASQHSKGILAGEGTQTNSDELLLPLIPITSENIKASMAVRGFQC